MLGATCRWEQLTTGRVDDTTVDLLHTDIHTHSQTDKQTDRQTDTNIACCKSLSNTWKWSHIENHRQQTVYISNQTFTHNIHSLKRFQLLCRRRNQRQPQVTTTSMWNSWRTWAPKLAPGCSNSSPESWLPFVPKTWRKAKVIAVEKPG